MSADKLAKTLLLHYKEEGYGSQTSLKARGRDHLLKLLTDHAIKDNVVKMVTAGVSWKEKRLSKTQVERVVDKLVWKIRSQSISPCLLPAR